MQWYTGHGYGISDLTDLSGRPLLTYQGPTDKKAFLLSDRVAQTFDFTVAQNLTAGSMKNARMDGTLASFIKQKLGGGSDDELDHKISLELGGSNAPANLFIQPGIKAGASAASDTLENNLALDVANGKISLLTAWRTLAEQKGFLLGEDSKVGTSFSINALASTVYSIVEGVRTSGKNQLLGKQNILLKAQMDADVEKIKQNPLDQKLLTKIFSDNVQQVSEELKITPTQAGGVVKSYLSGYAQSKNIDPRELMGSLNLNIQKIIDNSKQNPNVFGIPSTTLIKITGFLQSGSTILVTGGVILAIIGIFLAGPEAILGALSGGLLESIGAIFGVSSLTGIGLTAFAVGEALTVSAIGLNMTVKSMYDNAYLLPTQNIGALKDALAVQKGLSGFLPSAVTTTPSGSTGGGTTSSVKVFSGIVSQGQLGVSQPFTSRPSDLISNASDMQHAASNNLAPFLASLPGKVNYDIKLVSSVTLKDGSKQSASVQKVAVGTNKNGTTKYKTVVNKFAILELFIATDRNPRTKLSTVVLGPVDASTFQGANIDLTALATTIKNTVTTTDVSQISNVQTPTVDNVTATTTPAKTTLNIPGLFRAVGNIGSDINARIGRKIYQATLLNEDLVPGIRTIVGAGNQRDIALQTLKDKYGIDWSALGEVNIGDLYYDPGLDKAGKAGPEGGPDPIVFGLSWDDFKKLGTITPTATTTNAQTALGSTATTLYEWYTANNQSLPSVSDRAKTYELLGLGVASYYTGTAEQNNKLLAKLQGK